MVLAAAGRVLHELESALDPPERNRFLIEASFLARQASALLLEPEFPALEGFERLLDLDRARLAARQLAQSRSRQYQSFSRKGGGIPTPAKQIIREVEIPSPPGMWKNRSKRMPASFEPRPGQRSSDVPKSCWAWLRTKSKKHAPCSLTSRPPPPSSAARPGRSNSANPSQELCESRSNSVK